MSSPDKNHIKALASSPHVAKLLPALHHAVSGSVGTLISTCALYPLSLVITRLQVQRQIRNHPDPPSSHHDPRPPSPSTAKPSHSEADLPPPSLPQQSTKSPLLSPEEIEGQAFSDPPLVHLSPTAPPATPTKEVTPLVSSGAAASGPERATPSTPPLTPEKEEAEATAPTPPPPSAVTGAEPDSSPNRPRGRHLPETPTSSGDEPEYAGIANAFSRIYSTEGGVRALYSGLTQDATKSLLDSFLFFMFYELIKSSARAYYHRRSGGSSSSSRRSGWGGALEDLAVGMAAGAASRAFTTPIANVVTRKQAASLLDADAGAAEMTFSQVLREIRREKGIKGLWSGYSATLLLTLNPSITFLLQDALRRRVVGADEHKEVGARMTFLLAAVSKAAASAITYPFQIAKTRLQVGGPGDDCDGQEKRAADESDTRDSDDADSGYSSGEQHLAEKKLKAVDAAVRAAARRSIFGTVAQVARTEGVGALYDGIQAELLKGFFSHGTTMLAKDVVHKGLFRLYLLLAALVTEYKGRISQMRERLAEQQQSPSPSSFSSQSSQPTHTTTTTTTTVTEEILKKQRDYPVDDMSSTTSSPSSSSSSSESSSSGYYSAPPGGEEESPLLPRALQYRIPLSKMTARARGESQLDYGMRIVNMIDGTQRVIAKVRE